MKETLIEGLIKLLTIATALAQLLFAVIFFLKGEVTYGVFCGLTTAVLACYFWEQVREEVYQSRSSRSREQDLYKKEVIRGIRELVDNKQDTRS